MRILRSPGDILDVFLLSWFKVSLSKILRIISASFSLGEAMALLFCSLPPFSARPPLYKKVKHLKSSS
jgi:hypothetical protein